MKMWGTGKHIYPMSNHYENWMWYYHVTPLSKHGKELATLSQSEDFYLETSSAPRKRRVEIYSFLLVLLPLWPAIMIPLQGVTLPVVDFASDH
jgi:hypothetical protein